MLDKKSVIILYSGGTYDTAALAVAKAIEERHADVYVIDIDKEIISPWHYASLKRKCYVFAERNMPWLNRVSTEWNKLFAPIKISKSKRDYKEYKKPNAGLKNWLYHWKAKYSRVHNVMCRFEPDVVLCSTPELLAAANKAKHDMGQFYCSVAALITDYTLDKRFVHHKTDVYFVQNEGIRRDLIQYGIDADSICVSGTPVSKNSLMSFERDAIMDELGVENKDMLNIVVIGGRYGSANIKNVLPKFIDGVEDYNLIIAVGGSASLANYSEYIAKSKNNLKNIYFVDKIDTIAKLYCIADILLATPTAQVTYEAMCQKTPLILLKGSTVSERANAHYLASNGAALLGNNTGDAVASFIQLIDNPQTIEDIKEKQGEMSSENCADYIAGRLYDITELHFGNKKEVERKRRQIMQSENTTSKKKPKFEITEPIKEDCESVKTAATDVEPEDNEE